MTNKYSKTCKFRRFHPLSVPEDELSIETKAALGWLKNITGEEMLGSIFDNMPRQEVDITGELKDLKRVYEESVKFLETKEKGIEGNLISYMRIFLETHDKKNEVASKLAQLNLKMAPPEDDEDDE